MVKLRSLEPQVRGFDTRTTRLPPKVKDPIYNSPEFIAWRRLVVGRAGHQCEVVDRFGLRCSNGHPHHRVYADHVVELKDGGSLTDPANGQCLCASHHELKTAGVRMRRYRN